MRRRRRPVAAPSASGAARRGGCGAERRERRRRRRRGRGRRDGPGLGQVLVDLRVAHHLADAGVGGQQLAEEIDGDLGGVLEVVLLDPRLDDLLELGMLLDERLRSSPG